MNTELRARFDALPIHVQSRLIEEANRMTKNDYRQLGFDHYLECVVQFYFRQQDATSFAHLRAYRLGV